MTQLVHNLLVFADMMGETLAVAKAVPKPLKQTTVHLIDV